MATRRLYSDSKLIEQLVKSLKKVEVLDKGWSTKYVDPKTNEYWMSYQIYSENHGGDKEIFYVFLNLT